MTGTLLADIGGTHARFAWADGRGGHSPPLVLKVAEFPRIEDAFAQAMATRPAGRPDGRPAPRPAGRLAPGFAGRPAGRPAPRPAGRPAPGPAGRLAPGPADRALVALAGPVQGGRCVLTNSPWGEVRADALGVDDVLLLNDLEAQAWLLPHLREGSEGLGGPAGAAGPMLLITPGTGLGMALWVPGAGAVATEGGHATLAGADAAEDAVLAALRARFGHASAERALAGPGFANLAEAGAVDADAMWAGLLAGFAGSMALATGARGGVFLGGTIVNARRAALGSGFYARFLAKGRFGAWLEQVPLRLVTVAEPGLAGLGWRALA